MGSSSAGGAIPQASVVLDWHEARRRAGVPVLSVMLGPIALGLRRYRRWARENDHLTHPVLLESSHSVAREWAAALGKHPALRERALHAIASGLGVEPRAVARHADSHSRGALLLFERAAALGPQQALACAVLGRSPRAAFIDELGPLMDLLAGVSSDKPALVAMASEPSVELERHARQMVELVERQPALVGALALTKEQFALLAGGADARWKALLREGVVEVNPVAPAPRDPRGESCAPSPMGERARQALGELGADEALCQRFEQTARRLADDASGQARSLCEALLFDVLDGLPETAGCFELNGRLEFRFGSRHAEVDLLSRRLGLAIEIDGFYHFTGERAWRRDRRKDLLLQQHGYQVMRCLAGDVVERLTGLVSEIRDAVRQRKRALQEKQT